MNLNPGQVRSILVALTSNNPADMAQCLKEVFDDPNAFALLPHQYVQPKRGETIAAATQALVVELQQEQSRLPQNSPTKRAELAHEIEVMQREAWQDGAAYEDWKIAELTRRINFFQNAGFDTPLDFRSLLTQEKLVDEFLKPVDANGVRLKTRATSHEQAQLFLRKVGLKNLLQDWFLQQYEIAKIDITVAQEMVVLCNTMQHKFQDKGANALHGKAENQVVEFLENYAEKFTEVLNTPLQPKTVAALHLSYTQLLKQIIKLLAQMPSEKDTAQKQERNISKVKTLAMINKLTKLQEIAVGLYKGIFTDLSPDNIVMLLQAESIAALSTADRNALLSKEQELPDANSKSNMNTILDIADAMNKHCKENMPAFEKKIAKLSLQELHILRKDLAKKPESNEIISFEERIERQADRALLNEQITAVTKQISERDARAGYETPPLSDQSTPSDSSTPNSSRSSPKPWR